MENNKINIAEILKDCPTGMKLNCTIYEDVEFDLIDKTPGVIYPIHCLIKTNAGYESLLLTSNGCINRHTNAKCVIFPPNNTTWEGFISPNKFKNGDILYIDCTEDEDVYPHNKYIFILKEIDNNKIYCYCYIDEINNYKRFDKCWLSDKICNLRFATEKEKKQLFKAIKNNGYSWNENTKTLEKLNKLKFDINTLIPFESKVLVRDFDDQIWKPAIFGGYIVNSVNVVNSYYMTIGGISYLQLIPYEGNEHLLGKDKDCNDFYKTWRNN